MIKKVKYTEVVLFYLNILVMELSLVIVQFIKDIGYLSQMDMEF